MIVCWSSSFLPSVLVQFDSASSLSVKKTERSLRACFDGSLGRNAATSLNWDRAASEGTLINTQLACFGSPQHTCTSSGSIWNIVIKKFINCTSLVMVHVHVRILTYLSWLSFYLLYSYFLQCCLLVHLLWNCVTPKFCVCSAKATGSV